MNTLLKTFLIFTLCGLLCIAYAQKPQAPATSIASSEPAVATSVAELAELGAAKQQIRLLEAQLQLTREFQGSVLDTVYWGLGGVFVVVGLLLGFGWFANFKVYERDKDSLRLELLSVASKQGADLKTELIARAAELEKSIAVKADSAGVSLGASLDASIKEELSPIRTSLKSVDTRVFRLELDKRKDKMLAEPSFSMALTQALNLVEICRLRAEDEIPDLIQFMLQKLDGGGKFTASEITRVNKIIDDFPEHYKALTDRLRAKLVASDIF